MELVLIGPVYQGLAGTCRVHFPRSCTNSTFPFPENLEILMAPEKPPFLSTAKGRSAGRQG
jgi:hypothetical protein